MASKSDDINKSTKRKLSLFQFFTSNENSQRSSLKYSDRISCSQSVARESDSSINQKLTTGTAISNLVIPLPPRQDVSKSRKLETRKVKTEKFRTAYQLHNSKVKDNHDSQSKFAGEETNIHNNLVHHSKYDKRKRLPNDSYTEDIEDDSVETGYTNRLKKPFVPPTKYSLKVSESSETIRDKQSYHSKNDDAKSENNHLVEIIMSEIINKDLRVSWDDVAGLSNIKKAVNETIIWPMLRPDIFHGLRGPPRGLLLFGPPGNGKTLIGKCIASQSSCTFFSISASSLMSKWIGEGEKLVRTLFTVAREQQPSVIFIDEVDSLLSQRCDTEHESSRRMKTEFLVQLDGATTNCSDQILVIGATNRPHELDEAARRRFTKRLFVPLPELESRETLIKNLIVNQANDLQDDDIAKIAEITDGYSGADIAVLCHDAAMGPIRELDGDSIKTIAVENIRPIKLDDFLSSTKTVKSSVSHEDLKRLEEWNTYFGMSH